VNSTVTLSFRYRERDYVRALRAHYASHLQLPWDLVGTVVLVSIGAYLCWSRGLDWLGAGCLIIGVTFALMLFAAFIVIPPLVFRREREFRDDYTLTFSPEGIHLHTPRIDSQLQWDLYSRALVDAHSYLLYYGEHQFTVIPKRVFQSDEQQQAFELLLTQHIAKIVTQR
jgi:hypothetical protein